MRQSIEKTDFIFGISIKCSYEFDLSTKKGKTNTAILPNLTPRTNPIEPERIRTELNQI